MNDVIEKISKTLSETGKAVSEKTKMVGETAKLNSKIISNEAAIRSKYNVIGEFYYNKYKDNPDADIAATVGEITTALDEIDDMKAQLLSIKGAVKCEACGAECPIENSFCGHCGAKLVKPEPPKEEKPAEEAPEAEAAPEVLEGEVMEDTSKEE